MKIQFLLFMLTEISFGGELPGNWQQEWPVFLKSEMLRNQHAFFPLVKMFFIKVWHGDPIQIILKYLPASCLVLLVENFESTLNLLTVKHNIRQGLKIQAATPFMSHTFITCVHKNGLLQEGFKFVQECWNEVLVLSLKI